tara:strand:+ start:20 stop:793 length:774 start_codon:yes stop_codon:yes gene_type:complete
VNHYTIGLLTIATGRYIEFLPDLYASIDKNFLKNNQLKCYLFTDDIEAAAEMIPATSDRLDYYFFQIERYGFPGDTLFRYRHFSSLDGRLTEKQLDKPAYLFYSDADMAIVDEVGYEILPEEKVGLVATAHPGFYRGKTPQHPLGTPETRTESKAFISPNRYRPCYVAGGFNGGAYDAFISMSKNISDAIDEDQKNNITAVWHDESHLNEYVTRPDNLKRLKILTPSYCFAQSYNPHEVGYFPKIVALDKNHSEMRK